MIRNIVNKLRRNSEDGVAAAIDLAQRHDRLELELLNELDRIAEQRDELDERAACIRQQLREINLYEDRTHRQQVQAWRQTNQGLEELHGTSASAA